jgi:arginyl-tRNA synthetase
MVDLPSGKMKSREGTVVDADELIEAMEQEAQAKTEAFGKTEGLEEEELQHLYQILGMGALKFFLLKVDAHKRMLFDPEASIDFKGHTGVFIQYGHARVNSLLQKASIRGLEYPPPKTLDTMHETEEALLKVLHRFPEVLRDAAEQYNPSIIANWSYELTRDTNRFLYEVPVLRAETNEQLGFRLALMRCARTAHQEAMKLLGITVPARM